MTTQIYRRMKGRWALRVIAIVGFVLIALQVSDSEKPAWSLLVFSPVIAYGVFLCTREYNARVEVEGEEVRVINPWRTRRLVKSDIESLRWGHGWESKKGELICRDGSRLPVAGLRQPYLRADELADAEMARLREDLGLSNVDDTPNRATEPGRPDDIGC